MQRDFFRTRDDIESWAALTLGSLMMTAGARRRTPAGLGLALAAAPLVYRGIAGRWPPLLAELFSSEDNTQAALGGNRGIHVRESIRLERPVDEVYRWWRNLEHLPNAFTYLESVKDLGNGRSHWVALGPADTRMEWDAEIIEDTENERLSWRSLPGSDVVSAGSVLFETVRAGRSTQLTVHFQYEPKGGRAGAFIASVFGREPSQTVREDLRRVKQLLEAREIPRAASPAMEWSHV